MELSPWRKHLTSSESQSVDSHLSGLQNDINMLFDDFFNGRWQQPPGDIKQAFVPAIDVTQSDKSYRVKAELPGLDEKEVEVFIEDGHMVIKGEHKTGKEEKKDAYIIHEFSCGSFYRSIPLPKDANLEKAGKATLRGGILSVEIPRAEGSDTRKQSISIEAD